MNNFYISASYLLCSTSSSLCTPGHCNTIFPKKMAREGQSESQYFQSRWQQRFDDGYGHHFGYGYHMCFGSVFMFRGWFQKSVSIVAVWAVRHQYLCGKCRSVLYVDHSGTSSNQSTERIGMIERAGAVLTFPIYEIDKL